VKEESIATAAGAGPPRFERVVVGRRLQRRLEVVVVCGDIADVNARACVLGVFRDVTPDGAARFVDARLDGALADVMGRRMFTGNLGSVFVLPAWRSRLRADFVLLAGLGSFDDMRKAVGPGVVELVAENVVRACIAARIDEFAAIPFGAGSGMDPKASVESLLKGVVRAVVDADHEHGIRRLLVCELDPGRADAITDHLFRLSGSDVCAGVEITLDRIDLPRRAVEPAAPAVAAPLETPPLPIYLLVRQTVGAKGPEVTAAILTAGARSTAAIDSVRMPLKLDALDRLLAQAAEKAPPFARFDAFGERLAELTIAAELRKALADWRTHHLVVVHDPPLSRIPWESVVIDGHRPALEAGLSRRYEAGDGAVAKWLESRREQSTLTVLVIVPPVLDLDAPDEEAERLQKLLAAVRGVEVTVIADADATHARILAELGSGHYDIVHYIGHAFFDRESPSQSGIVCAGNEVLSGRDLGAVANLPALAFFNACESGRLRAARRSREAANGQRTREAVARHRAFAEVFLKGGIPNYIGTYWPVGDAAASTFAGTFYDALLGGESIATALCRARTAIFEARSADWADYMHYGNHEFRMKLPRAARLRR
jgi:hypothetical protein